MNSIKAFFTAPFSSMEAESIVVLINSLILVGAMLLVIGVIIILYKQHKRRKKAIRDLEIYMQEFPSDANLINEYESISSRMKEIFEEVTGSKDQTSLKTIVEIFQEVK